MASYDERYKTESGTLYVNQQQPGWISLPQNISNCPPGLEYLTVIDQLMVIQKIHLLEVFTGFDKANKYMITNALGQQAYYAAETTDCMTRMCCGPLRDFDIQILDNFQREELEVTGTNGTPLGFVVEEWSLLKPKFRVENANRETVLRVEGPICVCKCFSDVEFKILTSDGQDQIGKISKHWTGMTREFLTDATTFGVQFPMDLDVTVKATLLGATFLIDFMYFESDQR